MLKTKRGFKKFKRYLFSVKVPLLLVTLNTTKMLQTERYDSIESSWATDVLIKKCLQDHQIYICVCELVSCYNTPYTSYYLMITFLFFQKSKNLKNYCSGINTILIASDCEIIWLCLANMTRCFFLLTALMVISGTQNLWTLKRCFSVIGMVWNIHLIVKLCASSSANCITTLVQIIIKELTQYAHDVVLTSIRRRFKVMDAVLTSKQRHVLFRKLLGNFSTMHRSYLGVLRGKKNCARYSRRLDLTSPLTP